MSRLFELLRDLDDSRPSTGTPTERTLPPRAAENRMLTGHEWRTSPDPAPALVRYREVLRTHWRMSALFALVVVLTVTLITFLSKPIYEPVVALQIDPPGTEAFSLQSGRTDFNTAEYITTQTKKLQSNALGLELIRSLHLERVPEFAGSRAITTEAPSNAQIAAAENSALKTLRDRTTVKRDTASRIVYVSVGSRDPQMAAAVTNTLASMFVEGEDRARHEAVRKSSDWLAKQLEDIKLRMEESNKVVAEFEKNSGIASLGENQGGNTFSEQMIELNRQLLQARSDRIQLQAYLSRMGEGSTGTLPQVSSNPVVQALTQKLAETRAELTNQQVVYGPNHPNVRRLQNQASELDAQLNAQRAAILSEMRTSYQAAQLREGMAQSQVTDAGKKLAILAEYNAIKKEAEANTQLYNSLSAKIREAGITAESKSSPAWIVDPAPVLEKPTRPHKLAQISIGLLLGLFGGILLAFVLEGLDTKIHTTQDVQRTLGTVPVSIMPEIVAPGLNIRGALLADNSLRGETPPLFLLERPRSPEAEALRALYTSVRFLNGGAPQAILITSPDQGDGKTMMAANLAVALAERGKTCVVDADIRKEGVARVFGISSPQGLRELLESTLSLKDAIISTRIPNLSVLPAGKSCDYAAKLVCSDTMGETIRLLRADFDFILVDSPPVLPFADCRALSTLVDGVLLVGRAGKTSREALVHSLELLQNAHSAPVMQVVLNAVHFNSREYSHYYYGYSKDRARQSA